MSHDWGQTLGARKVWTKCADIGLQPSITVSRVVWTVMDLLIPDLTSHALWSDSSVPTRSSARSYFSAVRNRTPACQPGWTSSSPWSLVAWLEDATETHFRATLHDVLGDTYFALQFGQGRGPTASLDTGS